MGLRVYFKKGKLGFGCNLEFLSSGWSQTAKDPKTLRSYYSKDPCSFKFLYIKLDCGKP